jgi:hypothetical protein
MLDTKRRKFIGLLGGGGLLLAAKVKRARGQQPAMPVIGFLSSRSPGESAGVVAAFRQGLRETGFVEGRNLAIAFRWADGRYDSLPALAAELVDLPVTLINSAKSGRCSTSLGQIREGKVRAGGLMSYGTDLPDSYREAAIYAGRFEHCLQIEGRAA